MNDPDDEILDLVNENDAVIGTVNRLDYDYLDSTAGYLRAVGVFLINDAGELMIPVRTLNKRIAPGGLDFSAGEHVKSGETYDEAALRGIQEELQFTPYQDKLKLLGKLRPIDGLPYFHPVYLYYVSEQRQFSLNSKDFSSYRWLCPSKLVQELEGDVKCKETLEQSIELIRSLEDK